MLKPYTGKQRRLDFSVYDLEWYPDTLEVRLVGVFDEVRGYRSYTSVVAFLSAELVRSNRGRTYFAHAGGLADVQFCLDAILERDNARCRVKAAFSGSSAVTVEVALGRNVFRFCDSYWLLRDSLAKIGKSLGLDKGGKEYRCPDFPHCGHFGFRDPDASRCIFFAPLPLLRDYNALDCRILYAAVKRLEEEVAVLGGSLKSTIASTALAIFRSSFLSAEIATDEQVNKVCRDAYVASRVEVLARESGPLELYDVNSSFPHSMTLPHPGKLLGEGAYVEGDRYCVALATVRVAPQYLPPLPARVNGRVYFPTGTFRRWFVGEDLRFLLEDGGEILSVEECLRFEPSVDLASYVETIYSMRSRATDSFEKLVYKYLLNALYGKFGEESEKSSLLVNPRRRPTCQGTALCEGGECRCVVRYAPGIYRVRRLEPVAHAHVPWSASITASSRTLLTSCLRSSLDRGERVYYCDTDSELTTDRSVETSETELGRLKWEGRFARGRFLAPKLYALYPEDGGEPKIRAKGFPKLSEVDFNRLADGLSVHFPRMLRVGENLKGGRRRPTQVAQSKRAISHLSPLELVLRDLSPNLSLRPKREFLPGGDTVPWDYDALVR